MALFRWKNWFGSPVWVLAALGLLVPGGVCMPAGESGEAPNANPYGTLTVSLNTRSFHYGDSQNPQCVEGLHSSLNPVDFFGKSSLFLPVTPDITCDYCDGKVKVSGSWECPIADAETTPTVLTPGNREELLVVGAEDGKGEFSLEVDTLQNEVIVLRSPTPETMACFNNLQVQYTDGTGADSCVQYTVASDLQTIKEYPEEPTECEVNPHRMRDPKCLVLKVRKDDVASRQIFGEVLEKKQTQHEHTLEGLCGLDMKGGLFCEWLTYFTEQEFYDILVPIPVAPTHHDSKMLSYERQSSLDFTSSPTLVKAYIAGRDYKYFEGCAFSLTSQPESGVLLTKELSECKSVSFTFGPESQFSATVHYTDHNPTVGVIMLQFLQENAEDSISMDINVLENGPPVPRPVPSS